MNIQRIVKISLFFLFCLISVYPVKAQAASDNILGIWLSEDKTGKIEIYKSGNKYFGKLVWGKTMYESDSKTSKKDEKNQDASKRSRKLKDMNILENFVYNDGVWEGGTVYDPYSGKTYSSNMKLKDEKLNIRGYIGISLIGRTNIWTRVK